MTLKESFTAGAVAALRRFKLANAAQGAAGYNPTLAPTPAAGAAMGGPAVRPPGPVTPAPPLAADAAKSHVLG